jgi:hypothetical protein
MSSVFTGKKTLKKPIDPGELNGSLKEKILGSSYHCSADVHQK